MLNVEKKRLVSTWEIYLRNNESSAMEQDEGSERPATGGVRNLKTIQTRKVKFGRSAMSDKEVAVRRNQGDKIK